MVVQSRAEYSEERIEKKKEKKKPSIIIHRLRLFTPSRSIDSLLLDEKDKNGTWEEPVGDFQALALDSSVTWVGNWSLPLFNLWLKNMKCEQGVCSTSLISRLWPPTCLQGNRVLLHQLRS